MTYRDDSPSEAAALPTLAEYNRGAPPLEGGRPAGVRCPACASTGMPVEMRIGLVASMSYEDYVAVACPRCLLSGHRRCSEAEREAWRDANAAVDEASDEE